MDKINPPTRKNHNGVDHGDNLYQNIGGLNLAYVAEFLASADVKGGKNSESPHKIAENQVEVNGDGHVNARDHRGRVEYKESLAVIHAHIERIRATGYQHANTNPLNLPNGNPDLLHQSLLSEAINGNHIKSLLSSPTNSFGNFFTELLPNWANDSLEDQLTQLHTIYCSTTGYEFSHISNHEERVWLYKEVEANNSDALSVEQKLHLLERITRAEVFEQFLHKTFPGQRWYSLEGAEAVVALLEFITLEAVNAGVQNMVLGMPHRGRLNILTHLLGKPYADIITEFLSGEFTLAAAIEAEEWMADVKYHMGALRARDVDNNGRADINLRLLPNPSHLEMVTPVVIGAVRAGQEGSQVSDPLQIMGVILHGEAAFCGQGIVAETLNLSQLKGYSVQGTIHVLVNNQVGFTTNPNDSSSGGRHANLARGFGLPIVHVNGDDPEAVVKTAQLALNYRMRFKKDFLINLLCCRKYGHNESDDPTITQPVIYKIIANKPSAPQIYAEKLEREGVQSLECSHKLATDILQSLLRTKNEITASVATAKRKPFGTSVSTEELNVSDMVITTEDLAQVNETLTTPPSNFTLHKTVKRLLNRRASAYASGKAIDWAHAEALAFGIILRSGRCVRLTGQDVERGTFSQRHAIFFDNETGAPYSLFQKITPGTFSIYNSPLTELATLGFEYGYSLVSRRTLVVWEAQFGDFVNNAQSIIDEMIVSSKDKWNQHSSLTLLLPHGYEGQGPNHSHAHLERFLALSSKNNITVTYPTTAAQYFHLLVKQANNLAPVPKPLVVMSGKSLLRNKLAKSGLNEFSKPFQTVLEFMPAGAKADQIRRLIVCTGKVFVDLQASAIAKLHKDFVVLCIEQLYPLPIKDIIKAAKQFPNIDKVIWLQEEPENRGSWWYLRAPLEEALTANITFVGRAATASPAAGQAWLHKHEQHSLIEQAVNTLA